MSTRTWLATDYYEVLGVEPGASAEEITRAFRASAKDLHPDRTDDAESRAQFTALSAAYGVLGNARRRTDYDEVRAERRAAPQDHPRGASPAAPAPAPDRTPPVRPPDETRPLSVRALPERRHGRWASIGGIALLVTGIAAAGLVAWLVAAGPGATENGSDPTGRLLTLGLVAAKLIVVGIVFVVLGNRRRRHP